MIVDPFFESPDKNFTLVESECVSALATFDLKFDETKPARKVTKVGTGNQNDARYGKLT